ncbi:hypothetical protein [Pseudomonas sp. CM25]
MNVPTIPTTWADQLEVFLGTLHTVPPATTTPSADPERAVYRSYFEDREGNVLGGQSDWIVAGKEKPAYTFRFLLHSRSSDRLHFMITGSGPDHEKKVGISRNGYLGLYQVSTVSDFIKIEPLEWSENAVLCRLRDHLGHAVKARHDSATDTPRFSYLNAQAGADTLFILQRVHN